jgi:catechol-2,3-dioxygenase
LLGLKLTLDWGAFRFLSWDGYHHHLAINLIEGRNAAPISPEISGLESFSIYRDLFQKERPARLAFACCPEGRKSP